MLSAGIMRQYLTIILALTILSCNNWTENKQTEWKQIPFQETRLRIACTRVIKTLDNEVHGVHYIDNKGRHIDNDSINNLLYSISLFDDFSESNSTKYTTGLFELYEKTNTKERLYKLIVTSFLMENQEISSIDTSTKTQLLLQDFDLYLNDTIKQISIRVLNDYEVIKLKIDTIEIFRLSESTPVGLEKVIHKLDSLKTDQNASR